MTHKLFTTIFLLLVCGHLLFSQKSDSKSLPKNGPDHIIHSEITNNDYLIHVSLPKSYSNQDSKTYPTLYVLDGKSIFTYFDPSYIDYNKIEDVILVGISHMVNGVESRIKRFNDYTPYRDTISDRKIEKQFGVEIGTVNTGGANKFLDCLKTEIVPFIDKHYKANTERGITGHSLGGLFTAYCFLISDSYFTRFGINSPSFQLNSKLFLGPAVIKFTDNQKWDIEPTKVFISTGEDESPMMVSNMIKFSLYLKKRDYENVDMDWHIYRNETHSSVIPSSLNGTLTTLYPKE